MDWARLAFWSNILFLLHKSSWDRFFSLWKNHWITKTWRRHGIYPIEGTVELGIKNFFCQSQGFREAFVNFRVKIRIQFDDFFCPNFFSFFTWKSEHSISVSGNFELIEEEMLIFEELRQMTGQNFALISAPLFKCSENWKILDKKNSSNWMRILTRKFTKASLNPD